MPVNKNIAYKSPFYLFTGDLQTIFPALFRKVSISYKRERITTPDKDFLDLDWAISPTGSKKLVVISHGLEGDSNAPYALGMARALMDNDFDVLVWNFRGCSGEINRLCKFYHSGETEDLNTVISYVSKMEYESIYLIGFSIGGNITLKYLGEKRVLHPKIKAAVALSVPCHLESTAKHLATFRAKIYMHRFLKSLRNKIKEKAALMPNQLSAEGIEKIKDFYMFDTRYTAPLNGYSSAKEYWSKNSSIFYLENITMPTLIINAQNDPFLRLQSYPTREAEKNKNILLEIPEQGGHCGFYESNAKDLYWSEKRVLLFLKENN